MMMGSHWCFRDVRKLTFEGCCIYVAKRRIFLAGLCKSLGIEIGWLERLSKLCEFGNSRGRVTSGVPITSRTSRLSRSMCIKNPKGSL